MDHDGQGSAGDGIRGLDSRKIEAHVSRFLDAGLNVCPVVVNAILVHTGTGSIAEVLHQPIGYHGNTQHGLHLGYSPEMVDVGDHSKQIMHRHLAMDMPANMG